MGDFFKSNVPPTDPVLDLFELDKRDAVAHIDSIGTLWIHQQKLPKVLFGDVPVIIHTIHGFSIAPMEDASDKTGTNVPLPQLVVLAEDYEWVHFAGSMAHRLSACKGSTIERPYAEEHGIPFTEF